jgi:hypothetical protein
MPLPPKPRQRPLGPPVLFSIDGHDIRTRRDVELAFETWDAFLDRVAEVGLNMLDLSPGVEHRLLFHAVARLVPEAERRHLTRELDHRTRALCHRKFEGQVTIKETQTREGGLIQRLFRRAA